MILQEIRCKCNKLLAKKFQPGERESEECTSIPNDILDSISNTEEIDKDNVRLEIKCPKCGELNRIEV